MGNVLQNSHSGFEAIASSFGHSPTIGYHIDGAQALHTILDTPSGVGGIDAVRAPFGTFDQALTSFSWDSVILQPHYSYAATLGTDRASLLDFAALTNSQPRFYVMQVWPQQTWGNYQAFWDGSSPDIATTLMLPRREYYSNLMDSLPSGFNMVPTGEVFYALAERIDAGDFPELVGMSSFYRDSLHLSSLGSYVATATLFSTIYRQDITGLVAPAPYFNTQIVTPQLAAKLNSTIWDTILHSPYSGVNSMPIPEPSALFLSSCSAICWLGRIFARSPKDRTQKKYLGAVGYLLETRTLPHHFGIPAVKTTGTPWVMRTLSSIRTPPTARQG